MSVGSAIALRDIHLPQSPGWWPPAAGWWWLAALVLAVATCIVIVLWRRLRRRRALRRMFDRRVAAASSSPAQVAAISELLRRAAREKAPGAAALQGADWLAFLDRAAPRPAFDGELGRLLLEGGYRPRVGDAELEALRVAARARFLKLAGGRR